MDKDEILQILEDNYGTSNPLDISESDRWELYSNLKSNIESGGDPNEYTRQIILMCEVLDL